MKVTVFGSGYVGLVQATVLAEVGHDVVCIDIDETKVLNLQKGIVPIHEPGLSTLIIKNQEDGRLSFTTDAKIGVAHGLVQFICVGTPSDEDGSADLQYVVNVAKTIGQHLDKQAIIVNKSTVPVGTAEKVKDAITETLTNRNAKVDFSVISNPEFLKEGAAINDCMHPDRIVIGSDNPEAVKIMRELYEPFNRNHDRMIVMDLRSAELTKYAANSMLAAKISFMNEMANLAELVGADIEHVRLGIGSDPRIGYKFIYPGCGYGGSCFPKDVKALIKTSESVGFEPSILHAVESTNQKQKHRLFELIKRHFDGDLTGKVFAIWGLAFKADTDDMREAPSRVLMEALWEAGAVVQAYDPEAMNEAQRIYGPRQDLRLMGTKEATLTNANALIICTDWQNFKAPDLGFIKSQLVEPVVFDGRNLYDPTRMKSSGLTYYAIGRGESVLNLTL